MISTQMGRMHGYAAYARFSARFHVVCEQTYPIQETPSVMERSRNETQADCLPDVWNPMVAEFLGELLPTPKPSKPSIFGNFLTLLRIALSHTNRVSGRSCGAIIIV
jgi:hypothetical protein